MRSSRTVLTSKYVKALSLTLIACASIFLFVTPGRTADSPLIISEFRLRGPNGANDEFIEIYNNTDTAHVVTASDGSSGYGVFAADGVMRFFIPNGTVIPARGHYLGANSVAYSLSNYPAGNSNRHRRRNLDHRHSRQLGHCFVHFNKCSGARQSSRRGGFQQRGQHAVS